MEEKLAAKINAWIVDPLQGLVKWDRYGVRDDGNGFIFGWIGRDDGFYDFLVVNFRLIDDNSLAISYNTSSKKHSKEIGQRLKCTNETYLECRSAKEIIDEANLINWQKSQEFTVLSPEARMHKDKNETV